MIFSNRSAKGGVKSLRKLQDLLVDDLISLIIDLETSDSREATSSSVG